ncbi:NAD-P-binding protein [Epithele typhae]|uniref:NAD-P-binding protein n=1 Tax=Epithele typhae TaxID=378194 RepID=UPI00200897F8|nr:NAD-P-binding protein [Epithele typhae]KAH9925889.1 NAD-P-binding protein [Epithele typhae]
MSTSNKPLALIIGASGLTGETITGAMLKAGDFRLAALIRPASMAKSSTEALRAQGIEIRAGDVTCDAKELKDALHGVHTVVSAVAFWHLLDQKNVIRAAKEAGVQRIVPCDFGTPGARGIRELLDIKYEIHDFIEELGVPHTYIEVGWWAEFFIPVPSRSGIPEALKANSNVMYGDGSRKNLVTNPAHIGLWVARIVADPRTINQKVVVWDDEVTQTEAFAIAGRISGDAEALEASRTKVTLEELRKAQTDADAALKEDPTATAHKVTYSLMDYNYSIHFAQESTLQNAKKLGHLDAHELYPDLVQRKFEEFATEFYAQKEPGDFLIDMLEGYGWKIRNTQ